MAAVVNVNGRISGERDAVISVFDHGFLYGEGVYETLRTYGRVPFLYERHVQSTATFGEHDRSRGAVHRRRSPAAHSHDAGRGQSRRTRGVHPRVADARNRRAHVRPARHADAIGAVLRDQDLFSADEAFLTATTREIVPIVSVDWRTVGLGMPGTVTLALLAAFRKAARRT